MNSSNFKTLKLIFKEENLLKHIFISLFSVHLSFESSFCVRNMSYEDKRFCFNCKLDADQLKVQKKKLKTCSNCQMAQYCGQDCQRQEFRDHKVVEMTS